MTRPQFPVALLLLLSIPSRLVSLSLSSRSLATVVLVRVAGQLPVARGAGLAHVLQEVSVGHLPGVSELGGRAYGVGAAQAGRYGRLERESVLPVPRLPSTDPTTPNPTPTTSSTTTTTTTTTSEVLVEGEVGLRYVAVWRGVEARRGASGTLVT